MYGKWVLHSPYGDGSFRGLEKCMHLALDESFQPLPVGSTQPGRFGSLLTFDCREEAQRFLDQYAALFPAEYWTPVYVDIRTPMLHHPLDEVLDLVNTEEDPIALSEATIAPVVVDYLQYRSRWNIEAILATLLHQQANAELRQTLSRLFRYAASRWARLDAKRAEWLRKDADNIEQSEEPLYYGDCP